MVAAAKRRSFGPHCQPIEVRFWTKVQADTRNPDGCWLWTGGTDGHGYAIIWHNNKARGANRVAWELRNGKPFPPDLLACHTCDNPLCVRPDHIFPGTALDNAHDKIRKGRANIQPRQSHCQRGHEMIAANVVMEGKKRKCRACRQARDRRRSSRRAALTPAEATNDNDKGEQG